MSEYTLHLCLNLSCLVVKCVVSVFPFQRFHFNVFVLVLASYHDFVFVDKCNSSYATIIIKVVGRWVVFHEHHLCSFLQFERFLGGIGEIRESSFYFCLEEKRLFREFLEFVLVIRIGEMVVRSQSNKSFFGFGYEGRNIPTIELFDSF